MGQKLKAKLMDGLNTLDKSPLDVHHKYLLLHSIVLNKVNYGPMVEQCSSDNRTACKQNYLEIDYEII